MQFSGYQVKSDHRNQTNEKSQWCISQIDELKVFTFGFCKDWSDPNKKSVVLWSCSETFEKLGTERKNTNSTCHDLYFAKFVKDSQHVWHGYPVSDYDPQDKIPKLIKDKAEKYFVNTPQKSLFSKWMKGKL